MTKNRIRIAEGMKRYNAKHLAKINMTRIAKVVIPDANFPNSMLSLWNTGRVYSGMKSIHIQRMCDLMEVDANFLYGVSPAKSSGKIDPAIVSNSIDPLTIRTMCKSFGVDANALFNVKPMK